VSESEIPAGTPRTTVTTSLQTQAERSAGRNIADIFDASAFSTEEKLNNFPKFARRQKLKRFLALYEIFNRALTVKGSIIECGVNQGFGLMSWAHLSSMLEPENLGRRIFGFDTFEGFPSTSSKDDGRDKVSVGDLAADCYEELNALIAEYDRDRFLGHIPKVELVKGDAMETIPKFLDDHPELVVSVLFMDFDLYDATKVALETFVPRMPAGAILAFDELDNPRWPGETQAALHSLGLRKLRLERLPWDPYIAFAVLQ
jgi:hypothetical protein